MEYVPEGEKYPKNFRALRQPGDKPGRSDGNQVLAHRNDRRAKTLRSFSLIIYQVSGSEKRRKSIRQPPKPPPAPRRGQKTCVPGGSTSYASPVLRPPAGAILLFLFWTVHGPFSLFLLARKRENGGCNEPAIAGIQSPPARRASITPPPWSENASKPPPRRVLAPPPPGPPPPPPGWP